MKIAYISAVEILGPATCGGVQCAKRNLNLLGRAFGKENVFVYAITKNKEYLNKSTGNTKVFFSPRKKISVLWNVLSNRLQFSKDVENAVIEQVNQLDPDSIFLESSRMGYLQERVSAKIKQVLFLQNIEKDYIRNRIKVHPTNIVLKRAFEVSESLAVKNADLIITLNNRDATQLNKYYNCSPDMILPITMDDAFRYENVSKNNGKSELPQLLFVGALFPPNQRGVSWFINKVMPNVKAELTVVGKDFEKLSSNLTRSNVNIVGTVDDLSRFYCHADAVVSPILFGDGMKVKTAEALMYGKPMFATDEALEGYSVEGIESIYRCNTPGQFITAINKYAQKEQYESYDEKIRALFLERYHTPFYIPMIRDLLRAY